MIFGSFLGLHHIIFHCLSFCALYAISEIVSHFVKFDYRAPTPKKGNSMKILTLPAGKKRLEFES